MCVCVCVCVVCDGCLFPLVRQDAAKAVSGLGLSLADQYTFSCAPVATRIPELKAAFVEVRVGVVLESPLALRHRRNVPARSPNSTRLENQ